MAKNSEKKSQETGRTSFRLSQEDRRKLKEIAERNDSSGSAMIRKWIRDNAEN